MGVDDVYHRVHVPRLGIGSPVKNRPCLVGGSQQPEAFSFVASSHLAFFFLASSWYLFFRPPFAKSYLPRYQLGTGEGGGTQDQIHWNERAMTRPRSDGMVEHGWLRAVRVYGCKCTRISVHESRR